MNDQKTANAEATQQQGYFVPLHSRRSDDELTLGEILEPLLERRWLIVGVTLFFTLAATALAFWMRPVYRAEAVLAPVTLPEQSSSLLSLASQLPGLGAIAGLGLEDDETQQALALLQARQFTGEFITDYKLMPVLFESDWDAVAGKWAVPADEAPSLWDACKLFEENVLSVAHDQTTGIVTLAIEWRDPVAAANWANELIARANRRMRARAVDEAERSLDYLQRQLESTELVELRVGISRLIETQINKVMLANSREDYSFRVIDPAVPPDADDFVKPNRPLLIAAGLIGGLLVGILLAQLLGALRRARSA